MKLHLFCFTKEVLYKIYEINWTKNEHSKCCLKSFFFFRYGHHTLSSPNQRKINDVIILLFSNDRNVGVDQIIYSFTANVCSANGLHRPPCKPMEYLPEKMTTNEKRRKFTTHFFYFSTSLSVHIITQQHLLFILSDFYWRNECIATEYRFD